VDSDLTALFTRYGCGPCSLVCANGASSHAAIYELWPMIWGAAKEVGGRRRLDWLLAAAVGLRRRYPNASDALRKVSAMLEYEKERVLSGKDRGKAAAKDGDDGLRTGQDGVGDPNFRHSDDFRSVVWSGTPYTFTKTQAACVKVLWTTWKADTPELDGLTVVTQADVAQSRLIDVFRSKGKAHLAWGTMIVGGTSKGAYRLNDRLAAAPPKARRKGSRKTTRKTHQ
jgi:hypothetical protein